MPKWIRILSTRQLLIKYGGRRPRAERITLRSKPAWSLEDMQYTRRVDAQMSNRLRVSLLCAVLQFIRPLRVTEFPCLQWTRIGLAPAIQQNDEHLRQSPLSSASESRGSASEPTQSDIGARVDETGSRVYLRFGVRLDDLGHRSRSLSPESDNVWIRRSRPSKRGEGQGGSLHLRVRQVIQHSLCCGSLRLTDWMLQCWLELVTDNPFAPLSL